MDASMHDAPEVYSQLVEKCAKIGFNMPSDYYIGTLLRSLVASKPGGNFLELGTGIGLSLSWMIDGMDKNSKIISIDNDSELIDIVKEYFGKDKRVSLLCTDGGPWIRNYKGNHFDLIFADSWPGKYHELEETLELLKPGGFYLIDDMNPQTNWPAGHDSKAKDLAEYLERREGFAITKLNWSTGVILCVKIPTES